MEVAKPIFTEKCHWSYHHASTPSSAPCKYAKHELEGRGKDIKRGEMEQHAAEENEWTHAAPALASFMYNTNCLTHTCKYCVEDASDWVALFYPHIINQSFVALPVFTMHSLCTHYCYSSSLIPRSLFLVEALS